MEEDEGLSHEKVLVGERLFVGRDVEVADDMTMLLMMVFWIGLRMKHVMTKMWTLALQLGRMVN